MVLMKEQRLCAKIKLFCIDAPVMGGRYALLVLFSQDINEHEH
jgi:hypothetical protein